MSEGRIVVAGAGAVGCFVGGLQAASGLAVTLLGRARVMDELAGHGLVLTDAMGVHAEVPPTAIGLATDPACLADAAVVLVAVKSGATAEMARLVACHAPAGAAVVSLQNGLAAVDELRAALPGREVRAGMVGFNVVALGEGRFHRATSGALLIGAGPGELGARLTAPGLIVEEREEIAALQWGKLLLNLGNALNALSGLPLRDQLLDRDWRRLMADQIAEALDVLRAAGIAVRGTTPLPPRLLPHVLRLPTPLFSRLAAQMLQIDARARTSMAADLAAGRPTEIDAFQGAIVALGRRFGVAAPLCEHVMGLVRTAEAQGAAAPALTPAQVRP